MRPRAAALQHARCGSAPPDLGTSGIAWMRTCGCSRRRVPWPAASFRRREHPCETASRRQNRRERRLVETQATSDARCPGVGRSTPDAATRSRAPNRRRGCRSEQSTATSARGRAEQQRRYVRPFRLPQGACSGKARRGRRVCWSGASARRFPQRTRCPSLALRVRA